MIDLGDELIKLALEKRIEDDIEAVTAKYDTGPRDHLGASIIGHECDWYLWATFRWLFHPETNSRMQRLFNRGHLEEVRFIDWLRKAGFVVHDRDIDGDQIRIGSESGHFGGSCDGVAEFPPEYNIEEQVLLEFKTSGTGDAFNRITLKKVAIARPQHFAQMSIYGYNLDIRYALYMVSNKNDDSIHIEIVKLDFGLAMELEKRAEGIIASVEEPKKISYTPTYTACKYCAAKEVCHLNAVPLKNCRSCKFATVIDNGEWLCTKFNGIIPKDFIKTGCEHWEPLV